MQLCLQTVLLWIIKRNRLRKHWRCVKYSLLSLFDFFTLALFMSTKSQFFEEFNRTLNAETIYAILVCLLLLSFPLLKLFSFWFHVKNCPRIETKKICVEEQLGYIWTLSIIFASVYLLYTKIVN